MIPSCILYQAEVKKMIPWLMWRMKTVIFLAKQKGFETEEKGSDFQISIMLCVMGSWKKITRYL
jgi:hypothetical protein